MRRWRPTSAVALALLILVVTIVGAVAAHRTVRQQERQRDTERATTDVARFVGRVNLASWSTELVAARATNGSTSFRITATEVLESDVITGFALTTAEGDDLVSVVGPPSLTALGRAVAGDDADPSLTAAAAAAVTSGRARATGPVPSSSGPAMAVVVPVRPSDTADVSVRRATTTGLVVGIITVEELRNRGNTPLWPGADVSLEGPDGRRAGATIDDPLVETTIEVAGSAFTLQVDAAPHTQPLVGWIVLVVGLAVATGTFVVVRRQQAWRQRAEETATTHSRQLELIAATSSELQQSLDLAQLLPAYCMAVASEFDLDEIIVQVTDDEGRLHEVFRLPGRGGAGHPATFDLRRGWRTVGRLSTAGHRQLLDVERQSLRALADLLAVAVTNVQLYQREQQAVVRLSELDALKNAFLGTVSHELRTSTTAVTGFGELLAEHWDTLTEERRRELADRIRRQAGSLHHLVDDLLDFARLEHQSLRVSPRPVILTDLVTQLTDSLSPLVAGHTVVMEATPGVTAYADPVAVERILANLLSNAGKYSPLGTTITVATEHAEDRARLRVADQGPGIPIGERRRVFERFYRLSNDATLRTRGAGIGLAILHDFADRSGALVAIEDAPEGGTVVLVDFPVAPPEPTSIEPPVDTEVIAP